MLWKIKIYNQTKVTWTQKIKQVYKAAVLNVSDQDCQACL